MKQKTYIERLTEVDVAHIKKTYVERLPEEDPARLWLNVEVVEVVPLEGCGEAVADGAVIVRVLVAGRHAQDVRPDIRVLKQRNI